MCMIKIQLVIIKQEKNQVIINGNRLFFRYILFLFFINCELSENLPYALGLL